MTGRSGSFFFFFFFWSYGDIHHERSMHSIQGEFPLMGAERAPFQKRNAVTWYSLSTAGADLVSSKREGACFTEMWPATLKWVGNHLTSIWASFRIERSWQENVVLRLTNYYYFFTKETIKDIPFSFGKCLLMTVRNTSYVCVIMVAKENILKTNVSYFFHTFSDCWHGGYLTLNSHNSKTNLNIFVYFEPLETVPFVPWF